MRPAHRPRPGPRWARWALAAGTVLLGFAAAPPADGQIIDPTSSTIVPPSTTSTAPRPTTTAAPQSTTAPPTTAKATTTTKKKTTTTVSTVPATAPPPPSTVAPPASTTPAQETPKFKDQGDQGARALASNLFQMLGGFAVLALIWAFLSALAHSGRDRRVRG